MTPGGARPKHAAPSAKRSAELRLVPRRDGAGRYFSNGCSAGQTLSSIFGWASAFGWMRSGWK